MNQQMNVQVYGGSIARMEGQVFASLYVGQHVENEAEQNAKGIEIMKVSCDEKVYEDMNASKSPFDAVNSVRLKKLVAGRWVNTASVSKRLAQLVKLQRSLKG